MGLYFQCRPNQNHRIQRSIELIFKIPTYSKIPEIELNLDSDILNKVLDPRSQIII
jgi:hypothetical protein